MNKSELFKAAHKIAKSTLRKGDNYRVTFGAAIKMIKTLANKSLAEKLLALGCKVWEKGNMKRIYVADSVKHIVFGLYQVRDNNRVVDMQIEDIVALNEKQYFDLNTNQMVCSKVLKLAI